MPERLKDFISEETLALLLKVIPVALMATIISTAVKMKKEKITILNALLSIIVGVLTAWILSPVVLAIENETWHVPLIALVAISGDKIAEYVVYEFKVDVAIKALLNILHDKLNPKK